MNFDRVKFTTLAEKHDMKVQFIKKDGTIRDMRCTLRQEALPELKGWGRNSDPRDVTIVFDLDKKAWRSFRNDRVLESSVLGE
tara:strand:+ start:127 stop:375 length:249 start_codon:yes stop_codon:yes gene_type:complete